MQPAGGAAGVGSTPAMAQAACPRCPCPLPRRSPHAQGSHTCRSPSATPLPSLFVNSVASLPSARFSNRCIGCGGGQAQHSEGPARPRKLVPPSTGSSAARARCRRVPRLPSRWTQHQQATRGGAHPVEWRARARARAAAVPAPAPAGCAAAGGEVWAAVQEPGDLHWWRRARGAGEGAQEGRRARWLLKGEQAACGCASGAAHRSTCRGESPAPLLPPLPHASRHSASQQAHRPHLIPLPLHCMHVPAALRAGGHSGAPAAVRVGGPGAAIMNAACHLQVWGQAAVSSAYTGS